MTRKLAAIVFRAQEALCDTPQQPSPLDFKITPGAAGFFKKEQSLRSRLSDKWLRLRFHNAEVHGLFIELGHVMTFFILGLTRNAYLTHFYKLRITQGIDRFA